MTYHYSAYICHTAEDTPLALDLQKKLEAYAIPSTPLQAKSPDDITTFKPIFCSATIDDREEQLNDEELLALCDSSYLIVICSPNAANSMHIQNEIMRFKQEGRSKQIIALITAPKNNQSIRISKALKYKLDESQNITEEIDNIHLIDARKATLKTDKLIKK